MRTLLNLPDPSADWRGLAHVISKSDGLRDDVTLVVERDRIRFFDAECREIQTGMAPGRWTHDTMSQLALKLSLLDWLHERFPSEREAANPSPRRERPVDSFFTNEHVAPGNRSGASQSTS
jgi:hypothetical protein